VWQVPSPPPRPQPAADVILGETHGQRFLRGETRGAVRRLIPPVDIYAEGAMPGQLGGSPACLLLLCKVWQMCSRCVCCCVFVVRLIFITFDGVWHGMWCRVWRAGYHLVRSGGTCDRNIHSVPHTVIIMNLIVLL
jgi:hypothetical protein